METGNKYFLLLFMLLGGMLIIVSIDQAIAYFNGEEIFFDFKKGYSTGIEYSGFKALIVWIAALIFGVLLFSLGLYGLNKKYKLLK